MGEREWGNPILMINGKPVEVIPEIDFIGKDAEYPETTSDGEFPATM